MTDTITLLDPLQFAKTATSDVWTIDGEGPAYEAVKTFAVTIPQDVSAARVIINNNYDTTASRVHVRVKATKVTALNAAGITKTETTQALEWVAVAAQAIIETGAIDLSTVLAATLHIDCAISSTTAHDGTEIIVQGRKESGLDEWTDLARFVGPTGTATKSDCSGDTAAGQTVVGVTNPATGNLNHLGKFIFLEDTDTIAQCEIAYLTAQSGD
jgi:hypothetical protein